MLSPTAALSDFVMSVQLRLLANAPGSLRPSVPALEAELEAKALEVNALDGNGELADDVAADGEVAPETTAADDAGGGPPLAAFDVHALSKTSATQLAETAVATDRVWRRRCHKVGPIWFQASCRDRGSADIR